MDLDGLTAGDGVALGGGVRAAAAHTWDGTHWQTEQLCTRRLAPSGGGWLDPAC